MAAPWKCSWFWCCVVCGRQWRCRDYITSILIYVIYYVSLFYCMCSNLVISLVVLPSHVFKFTTLLSQERSNVCIGWTKVHTPMRTQHRTRQHIVVHGSRIMVHGQLLLWVEPTHDLHYSQWTAWVECCADPWRPTCILMCWRSSMFYGFIRECQGQHWVVCLDFVMRRT
jgi:hypothetical protein